MVSSISIDRCLVSWCTLVHLFHIKYKNEQNRSTPAVTQQMCLLLGNATLHHAHLFSKWLHLNVYTSFNKPDNHLIQWDLRVIQRAPCVEEGNLTLSSKMVKVRVTNLMKTKEKCRNWNMVFILHLSSFHIFKIYNIDVFSDLNPKF